MDLGADGRFGFEVTDLDFGLGIFTDRVDASRTWTTMAAEIGRMSLVGLPKVDLSASDVALSYVKLPTDRIGIDLELSPLSFGDLDLDPDLDRRVRVRVRAIRVSTRGAENTRNR